MSSIQKIAVLDDRVHQRDPVQYAVQQGALSVTNTNFTAVSSSASQVSFQVQVPSEKVFVDKAIDWTSTCNLSFTVTVTDSASRAGQQVCQIGKDISLSSFPLHTLVSTLSATINDTTVTSNTSDVLRELLRLADSERNRELRTCPTYLDTYASYNDAVGTQANPLAGYENAQTGGQVPNGAYYDFYFTNSSGAYIAPPVVVSGTATYNLNVQFTSKEKLVLSPFCWADTHEGETGLFGIQNIQVIANMLSPSFTGPTGRVLRTTTNNGRTYSNLAYNQNAGAGAFTNASLSCLFLTPSLSFPIPSVSRVPYMEFPKYSQAVAGTIASGAGFQGQSQTITLPCIPDLIILTVKPQNYQAGDADFYFPITNVSINFDNFSGLLSSMTPMELFTASSANGLRMDYNAWQGQGWSNGDVKGLVGGFLVLKPSRDIALQQGQAPSIVSNITFQFNYTAYNPSPNTYSGYVVNVITANSGFLESISGSSRVVKGVLSEKDVIEADKEGAVSTSDLKRYVGGKASGLMSNLSHGLSKALPLLKSVLPIAKHYLPAEARDALSMLGMGRHKKHSISKRLM